MTEDISTGEAIETTSLDVDPGTHLTDLVQQEPHTEPMLNNNNVRGQEGALPDWYWFKNDDTEVKGEGAPPEWFNSKTFKSIEDQAKAHPELRKLYNEKLKGLSGAPQDGYTYDMPKEFAERGYQYNTDNPYYQDFLDLAHKNELSQDMVNQMTDMLVESVNVGVQNQEQSYKEHTDSQYNQLTNGDKDQFETAIKMAVNTPNVDKTHLNTLLEELTTADSIKAFTALITQNKYSALPGPEVNAPRDSYERQNELRDRLHALKNLRGQQHTAAKAALIRDYEELYPGVKEFG